MVFPRPQPSRRCCYLQEAKCPGSTHGTPPCEMLQNRSVLDHAPFLPDEGLDPRFSVTSLC